MFSFARDAWGVLAGAHVPVYDEPEDVWRLALASVVANRPSELIAVVDGGDFAVRAWPRSTATACCGSRRRGSARRSPRACAPAHPDTDVGVVLDADTTWAPGALTELPRSFADPSVGGGVTPRQAVFEPGGNKGCITRPDRPDLSAVRSSLLPHEPAPEIFMAMQGDHAS